MKTTELFRDKALPDKPRINAGRKLSEKYDCKLTMHFNEMSILFDRGYFIGGFERGLNHK
jgi:hypothetical protein